MTDEKDTVEVPGPGTEPEPIKAVPLRRPGRWIAGQELGRRTGTTGGDEVLVSHHGHLVWVDQQSVRES